MTSGEVQPESSAIEMFNDQALIDAYHEVATKFDTAIADTRKQRGWTSSYYDKAVEKWGPHDLGIDAEEWDRKKQLEQEILRRFSSIVGRPEYKDQLSSYYAKSLLEQLTRDGRLKLTHSKTIQTIVLEILEKITRVLQTPLTQPQLMRLGIRLSGNTPAQFLVKALGNPTHNTSKKS